MKNKLIRKLVRIEDNIVKDIEKLQTEILKTEYISFNALVRKLIKIGLDNWK